jgi:hypothetical protein
LGLEYQLADTLVAANICFDVPSPVCRTCNACLSGWPWHTWNHRLPMASGGLAGVTGGVGGPGDVRLPESATGAVCVIIAWLAAWTTLGAWRMMTRDA